MSDGILVFGVEPVGATVLYVQCVAVWLSSWLHWVFGAKLLVLRVSSRSMVLCEVVAWLFPQ